MNINFGLLPDLAENQGPRRKIKGKRRRELVAERAVEDLVSWRDNLAISLRAA